MASFAPLQGAVRGDTLRFSQTCSRRFADLLMKPRLSKTPNPRAHDEHQGHTRSQARCTTSMQFHQSGLWCSSDLVPMLCRLSVLPGQPSRATFAGAPFAIHRLWAMSSIVCLIALISVTSGPNFLACSKMLRGACVCSCGTGTRSLSAIVSLPCCRRLRHEHNPVLISQAG